MPTPSQRSQLPTAVDRPQLLPAVRDNLDKLGPCLQRLCALKNHAQFTPFALESWVAVLSVYPTKVVVMSVLEMAVSPDPFPDIGKIIARCQQELAKDRNDVTQRDSSKVGVAVLREMAVALGLGRRRDENSDGLEGRKQ